MMKFQVVTHKLALKKKRNIEIVYQKIAQQKVQFVSEIFCWEAKTFWMLIAIIKSMN